jgi:hypothetical protein
MCDQYCQRYLLTLATIEDTCAAVLQRQCARQQQRVQLCNMPNLLAKACAMQRGERE